MKLLEIDKVRYRRHLNLVIAGCIGSLAVGSLAISQTLIGLFPDESGSHFNWNLTGVVITSVTIAWLLNKYRYHGFMTEVAYVWDLKQVLNKINRRMLKLKAASHDGNLDALNAIHYSYAGSRLLWQLDDNTLVMDELIIQQTEIDNLAKKYNLTLDVDNFDKRALKQF